MESTEDLQEAVEEVTDQSDKEETGQTKAALPEGISKNQMKKLLKRQRWLEQKTERRALEKQKKKEKRQALKDSGEPLPASRKRLKRNSMKNSTCKVKVAIDCSFDDLMNEKDICQLVQQLNHCYAANRRIEDPLQFYITSLSGKAKNRMDSLGDYKGWDVYTKTDNYEEVFGKENVVYLTSESPNVLTTMEADKAYIIGGLVDHNHQKGLCYRLAQEKGIAHAQLPISEYLELKTRKVLTINHVFEILVQFTQTQSWEKAFFKVIPNRKVEFFKSTDTKDTKSKDSPEKESKSKDEAAECAKPDENCKNDIEPSSVAVSHQRASAADASATCTQNDSSSIKQEEAPPSNSQDHVKSEPSS